MKFGIYITIRKEIIYTEVMDFYDLKELIGFMVKKFKNQINNFQIIELK